MAAVSSIIDWRARPVRSVRYHMALIEAAVEQYAEAVWERITPHLMQWLRYVLKRLRPELEAPVERTANPEVARLQELIEQFAGEFAAPDISDVLKELGPKIALQYGFLPSDPRTKQLKREFERVLRSDLLKYWDTLTSPQTLASRLASLRQQGLDTERIIERVQLQYGAEYYTAERLVRTLYTSGANNAQLEALRTEGYTHKRWLTARDNRVRVARGKAHFDHRQMDGVIVPIDEPFVTPAGSRLMYPGDRSLGAPGGDIINCRCTIVGV